MPLSQEVSPELQKIVEGKIPRNFDWDFDEGEEYGDFKEKHPIPEKVPVMPTAEQLLAVEVVDESLRDGLHGLEEYPSVEQMLNDVDLAHQIGIRTMTVGIYSGEGENDEKMIELLKAMKQEYPEMTPIVLSLAKKDSIDWAVKCHEVNDKLQTIVFMGSAPWRLLVENWTEDYVLETLGKATKMATEKGLFVIGATENTTQTPPDFLKQIIETQIENGAQTFCIADTVGIAMQRGTQRIVSFVNEVLKEMGKGEVVMEWHGHQDSGLAFPNALTAVATGVRRAHVTTLGIGERAGNTPMEIFLLMANRILINSGHKPRWDTTKLRQLQELYTKMTKTQLPTHGPMGARAFTTSLGIHTAAMKKARRLAVEARELDFDEEAEILEEIERTIYTAFDPNLVGEKNVVKVSHWSGHSTVELFTMMHELPVPPDSTIEYVLRAAKDLGKEMKDEDVLRLLGYNSHNR